MLNNASSLTHYLYVIFIIHNLSAFVKGFSRIFRICATTAKNSKPRNSALQRSCTVCCAHSPTRPHILCYTITNTQKTEQATFFRKADPPAHFDATYRMFFHHFTESIGSQQFFRLFCVLPLDNQRN